MRAQHGWGGCEKCDRSILSAHLIIVTGQGVGCKLYGY